MRIFLVAVAVALLPASLSAQSRVATTAAQFLGIGIGARAVAMGSAQVATAPDVASLYWNTAGIARNKGVQLGAVHSRWLVGTTLSWAGLTYNIPSVGTFGAAATLLSSGDIERTTERQPDGTGDVFSANDVSIQLSYAASLTERFSVGGSIKFISQSIWTTTATGVALDLGVLYDVTDFLRIGATMYNFGTQMNITGDALLVNSSTGTGAAGENNGIPARLATDNFNLPLVFKIGVALQVVQDKDHLLVMALDGVAPNDNNSYLNLGAEYAWRDLLFARAGYNTLFLSQSEMGLAFGVGVKYGFSGFNFRFDYTFQTFGRLNPPQWLSLALLF